MKFILPIDLVNIILIYLDTDDFLTVRCLFKNNKNMLSISRYMKDGEKDEYKDILGNTPSYINFMQDRLVAYLSYVIMVPKPMTLRPSPIDWAIHQGYVEVLDYLYGVYNNRCKQDIRIFYRDFLSACRWGKIEVCKYIMSEYDINKGEGVFSEEAIRSDNLDMLKWLYGNNFKMSEKLLSIAILCGRKNIVQYLYLELGYRCGNPEYIPTSVEIVNFLKEEEMRRNASCCVVM